MTIVLDAASGVLSEPAPAILPQATDIRPPWGVSEVTWTRLQRASVHVREAEVDTCPSGRFLAAQLAVFWAASAAVAELEQQRVRQAGARKARPRRSVNVWDALAKAKPELSQWCAVFAASARLRDRIECGVRVVVTAEQADRSVTDARQFLRIVGRVVDRRCAAEAYSAAA